MTKDKTHKKQQQHKAKTNKMQINIENIQLRFAISLRGSYQYF